MSISLKPSVNWLLVFIPISVGLGRAPHVPPPVLFFAAAMAIVPIARLIVLSTEQVAERTGDAVGGLLNATFGNAPELIISLVALRAGYVEMVRASIVGAILANLLLALGVAFLLGGLRRHEQFYNAAGARAYSSMMMLAAAGLAVPSGFSRYFAPEGTIRQEEVLGFGIAAILLGSYALYLFYSLVTHRDAFAPERPAAGAPRAAEEEPRPAAHKKWPLPWAIGGMVGASVLAAWMSEILVGAAEGTGESLGMSQVFIGIVFLAVVGGAAESFSAVAMARSNRMDLALGIALGSCIQIALFVAPVLVLASYVISPRPLELSFNRAELGSLMFAVIIGTVVCGDGHANWFKGVQLIALYALIAVMFYLLPAGVP